MAEKRTGDRWSNARIVGFAPDDRSIPAARDVLKKGGFGTVEATADGRGWWVVCQGITDTYQVSVRWDEAAGEFACDCTCPSPKYPCKHALALLLYLSEHPELRVEKQDAPRAGGDFEPLIRAVFANPDDDTPRLIFADFLDENGQADRAALIRLQCGTGKRTKTQKAQEKKLIARLLADHVEPLPGNFEAAFERGFLTVRAFSDYDFDNVDALPARFVELFRGGWVARVILNTFGYLNASQLSLFRQAGELDVSPHPLREEGLLVLAAEAPVGGPDSRLGSVKVHKSDEPVFRVFSSGGTERLPRTPRMHGPQGPERRYTNVSAAQLGLLIRAGRLDGVETLYLDGPIGDTGAELLANADDLRRLHSLTLTLSNLTADGAQGLVALGHFPALRELTLRGALTGPPAFAAMVRGSGLASLTALHLHNETLGADGVRALADATHFSRLETLRLFECDATASGVEDILASEHFPALGEVHLQCRAINAVTGLRLALNARDRRTLLLTSWSVTIERTMTKDGFRVRVESEHEGSDQLAVMLRGSPNAARVYSLAMRNTRLTAKAMPDLAASLSPDRLTELDLSNNRLGNDGAAALVASFQDFRPETLVLSRNVVRKSGAVALANSPVLSGVKVLDLTHNNIGFNGVSAIAGSPHLMAIRELRLQGTNLTLAEWKQIEAMVGKNVVV